MARPVVHARAVGKHTGDVIMELVLKTYAVATVLGSFQTLRWYTEVDLNILDVLDRYPRASLRRRLQRIS